MRIQRAGDRDADAIAAVYNQGVAERIATFQAEPVPAERFRHRIAAGDLFMVAFDDDGACAGAAWVSAYDRPHDYYSGVGEVTVYVDQQARRTGVGLALLEAIAGEVASAGTYKLVAKVFADNAASLRLFEAGRYRIVGTHRRHSRLDGEWKDVVVVERDLTEYGASG